MIAGEVGNIKETQMVFPSHTARKENGLKGVICSLTVRVMIGTILCFVCAAGTVFGQSFSSETGIDGWQVNVRNAAFSLESNDMLFRIGTNGSSTIGYSAHDVKTGRRTGPLQAKYVHSLSELLGHTLNFAGMKKSSVASLNLEWELYPEKIENWARVWKENDLSKNWNQMDRHKRYEQLVKLISDTVCSDMQPVMNGLGFKAAGASMEKMTYQPAHKLDLYKAVLEPAGIPKDLIIPIPLMLWIKLAPAEPASGECTLFGVPKGAPRLDDLFVTATQKKTNVYCTYQRDLDKFELSGDTLLENGGYQHLRPLSQREYQSIGQALLKACLEAAGADQMPQVSIEINLTLYPGMLTRVIQHFNQKLKKDEVRTTERPQLPAKIFHIYTLDTSSPFSSAVNPFFEPLNYRIDHFQLTLGNTRKAGSIRYYDEILKPIGFSPDARPVVPDIVYLIIKKK